jgi:cob(I)alamin adenosyltransferase
MGGDTLTNARHGYIQVYTGNGKGKTTASLGLIVRALGQGLRPALLQFMKSDPSWGEIVTLKRLGVPVQQCGLDHWVVEGEVTREDLSAAAAGCVKARALVESGDYDLVVLDELVTALYFKLLPLDSVLTMMAGKPTAVELVMTGRHAPRALIAAADLVTEMRPLKHYSDAGVGARRGIEF